MSLNKPSFHQLDGTNLRFAIISANYNSKLVQELKKNTILRLKAAGVSPSKITSLEVPGSGEIPCVAAMSAMTNDFDCIIGLGVILAGETPHFEILAHSTAKALQDVGIRTNIPIINGIIVANTQEQAEERCQGKINRGIEFANAALQMAQICIKLAKRIDEVEAEEFKFEDAQPFTQN